MTVELAPVEGLEPHARNARTHDKKQIARCCQLNRLRMKFAQPRPILGDRCRPSGLCLGAEASEGRTADQVSLDVEGVVDRGVGGEKSLG